MKVKTPSRYRVGSTMSANTSKVWSDCEPCPRKPSATKVLETERMKSEAREALSLAVCALAPWRVKCSVVRAVRSS
jgi:hypothetical protein